MHTIPVHLVESLLIRIKMLSGLDVTDQRLPQDGRLTLRGENGDSELRLSSMPTISGEKMVLRFFNPEILVKPLNKLGWTSATFSSWCKLLELGSGMILVTGPTGSGKTTTLYSSLKHLANPKLNICTIEDPVELIDPDFNQTQVRKDENLDFHHCLRSILRQDPDIIMLGEIRDPETASTAVQAALTGHLVLATLHTNGACESLDRLLDLGVAGYLLRTAIKGVLAQRMVRYLCPGCKQPDQQTGYFIASGCVDCQNLGISHRGPVFELLVCDDQVSAAMTKTSADIRQAAAKAGMISLEASLKKLLKKGQISEQEYLLAKSN